jgi:hypothetical protein
MGGRNENEGEEKGRKAPDRRFHRLISIFYTKPGTAPGRIPTIHDHSTLRGKEQVPQEKIRKNAPEKRPIKIPLTYRMVD